MPAHQLGILLTLIGKRLFPWNKYFYSGLGGFLQSSAQGITLQTCIGGGIGRYLKNTNRSKISVLGGFSWQSTNYHPSLVPVGTQNLAAAMVATDIKFFSSTKPVWMRMQHCFQPSLSPDAFVSIRTLLITLTHQQFVLECLVLR